jgi:YidC/Oxa1 family membrane protein insertase
MQLYQEEKVNPMAGLGGCLPMLLQLPVFICLLKVLQLDIDLYHAPFFGYVHDLSAPDPLSIVNLFGLLPFDPATVPLIGGILNTTLHIGPVAILYGASMWLSQQMNPTATGIDPMQKRMLSLMPLFMVFFFSSLAIGIMIYYLWSNILTMFQQYLIMRHLKVDNPIDDIIGRLTGKTKKNLAA